MGGGDGRETVVVTDTSIVVNFLKIGRLDLLTQHPRYRFVVTEHVEEEVEYPEQEEELARAMSEGKLELVPVTDEVAIREFGELEEHLGRGEASCIALAHQKGWLIATDERGRTLAEIRKRLGESRLLTTATIIRSSIQSGAMSVEDADQLIGALAAKKFVLPFKSFRDFV